MEKEELLNEEKYQKTNGKIKLLALIILLVGLIVGGFLIYTGVSNSKSIDKNKVQVEKNEEFMKNGFSERYYELQDELHKAQSNGFYFTFGPFIIITACMFSGAIYLSSKSREIAAYKAQQIMPVAQEGMEKMAPSVAKVGKTMAEEMAPVYKDLAKEIAPAYGEIAKEIAKGVKEGMKDEDK